MQSYFVVSAESYKSIIVFKTMTYLLFAFQLGIIVLFIRYLSFFQQASLSLFERLVFFGIKVLFGFLLIAVYTQFYPQRNLADVFKYFDDANIIFQNAQTDSLSLIHFITGIGFERNSPESNTLLQYTHHIDKKGAGLLEANHLLIIRLHLLLRYISNGSIYIHSLWFSFFSFTGCVALYRKFVPFFEKRKWLLKVPLFLLPSLLFWGSGLLKESIVLLCVGGIIYQLDFDCKKNWRYSKIAIVLLFSTLLWFIKPYIALSFGIAYLFTYLYPSRFKWLLVILPISFILFGNTIANSLIAKRNEYTRLAISVNAGSILDTTLYKEEGMLGLAKLSPSFFKALLLSPLSYSPTQKSEIPFSIENLLFLILLLYLSVNAFSKKITLPKTMVFIIIFALLQLIVIGFSIPVVGAIVRYKITAMPFLWISVVYTINLIIYKCE